MYSGNKMTFWQLFESSKWKVEIPIIQRDYAQGRKSSSEIRSTFLDALYEHLSDPQGSGLDLDFVYGSIKEGDEAIFVPLDGQQRLTTLFLLHWYLSHHDQKQDEFQQMMRTNKRSRFTYETRTSSQEFCDSLVAAKLDLMKLEPESEIGAGDQLSQTVIDSPWYMRSWGQDPTIQSMLVMIDAIHNRFGSDTGLFERLTRTENPLISFQFLNLSEFRLTEDLYVKMNSRGKQLTPFENFKAKLEQYIGQNLPIAKYPFQLVRENKTIEVSAQDYFSHKIDTDWANIFWGVRDSSKLIDQQLMNFIRVVTTNHVASLNLHEDQDDHLKLLIGKEDPNREDETDRPISFAQYREIGCLTPNLIVELIAFFDQISDGSGRIVNRLQDGNYFDEHRIFARVIKNNLTSTHRIRFYAYYRYLNQFKTTEGLEDWMRVVYNLTENYSYNRREEFARSIRSIRNLMPHANDILGYISNPNNPLSGFYSWQIIEERIKAILILKTGHCWREQILQLERHGYFNGQIGFLLDFAGIESYFEKNKNCTWSVEEEREYFDSFCTFGAKANTIWGDSGLKSLPDYLWERALISKGNYLLSNGVNLSFLINNDRDISWKRLLREDNDGKRKFVKDLLNDIDFNENEVQQSLREIISKAPISDWRRYFVSLTQPFQLLGEKRFIRWNNEGNTILLLRKAQRNGYHAEYYSYGFYHEKIKNADITPFSGSTYLEGIGEEYVPSIRLSGWNWEGVSLYLFVYIIFNKNQFTLEVESLNNHSIPESIVTKLGEFGFSGNSASQKLKVSKSSIEKKFAELLVELRGLQ